MFPVATLVWPRSYSVRSFDEQPDPPVRKPSGYVSQVLSTALSTCAIRTSPRKGALCSIRTAAFIDNRSSSLYQPTDRLTRRSRRRPIDLLGGIWPPADIAAVSQFVSQGLFPPGLALHQHQRDVFEQVVVQHRDAVVTTGTGSGKTESFLLPVVASIVRESRLWPAPTQRPAQWDWWSPAHITVQGNRQFSAARVAQRGHETRPAAIRALILYPLNALVEDQLARLRRGLDGPAARAWLDANRDGNRIYFGRYTGRTPVSGDRSPGNVTRLRDELRSIDQDAQAVAGNPAQLFFQDLEGAEAWSRWDMQDTPPDILITNYSMLNIMLMRAIETSIFDRTRQWLSEAEDRIFHLVVDELHTYRGTPGTEVAYLLRVLLDRLGLSPDSNQLRIISSSASLQSGAGGLQYLQEFFGRNANRFSVIGGSQYVVPPNPTALMSLSPHGAAFAQFGQNIRAAGANGIAHEADALHLALLANGPAPALTPPETLNIALQAVNGPDALRLACSQGGQQIIPASPGQLAAVLFPGAAPGQAEDAVDGLLTALSYARSNTGQAPLPMRAHLMMRNLQGLWVCTNPGCNQAPPRTAACPTGRLHYLPALTCQCGSRILELLYREACGEVFFGGYRRDTGNPNEWYLSPDHPDLEAAPDLASLDRDYLRYAVFWPSNGIQAPATAAWNQKTAGTPPGTPAVRRTWAAAHFDPADGKVGIGGGPGLLGHLYFVPPMHGANPPSEPSGREPYPSICPRCDADWRSRDVIPSPIRTQRTGFQKIAQVLSDALLRDLSQPPLSSDRKLVVFSDSRQDAAKLSAGMRFSHYRDALRQALISALDDQAVGPQAFAAQFQRALSPAEQHAAASFLAMHPADAAVLAMAATPAGAALPNASSPGLTNAQVAQRILQRAAQGPHRLTQLAGDIGTRLLSVGMNPAGYTQDALWTDPQARNGAWRDLYDWPLGTTPAPKAPGLLLPQQQAHLARIQNRSLSELIDVFFASGRRSLESLRLALPTTDRLMTPAASALIQEAADGVIFLFGARKRLSTHSSTSVTTAPAYVRGYLAAIALNHGLAPASFTTDVLDHLSQGGYLNTAHFYLNVPALCLSTAATSFFECTQCRRVHLNPSGGICADCLAPLGPPQPTTGAQADPDYYSFLAHAGELFRLNCEELTGQTNKPTGEGDKGSSRTSVCPHRRKISCRSRRSAERHDDDGGWASTSAPCWPS